MPNETTAVQGNAPPTRVRSLLAMPSDVTEPLIHSGFALPAFRYVPLTPPASHITAPDRSTLSSMANATEQEAPLVRQSIPTHPPTPHAQTQELTPLVDRTARSTPPAPQPPAAIEPPRAEASSQTPQDGAPFAQPVASASEPPAMDPPALPISIPGVSKRSITYDLAYKQPVTQADEVNESSEPPPPNAPNVLRPLAESIPSDADAPQPNPVSQLESDVTSDSGAPIVPRAPVERPEISGEMKESLSAPMRYAPEVLARARAIQAQFRSELPDDRTIVAQPHAIAAPPAPQPSAIQPTVQPVSELTEHLADLPQIMEHLERRLNRLERSQQEAQRIARGLSHTPVQPADQPPPPRILETRSLVRVITHASVPPGKSKAFWERQSSSFIRSKVLR